MSYDIYMTEPVGSERIVLPWKHAMTGGTYCLGGTNELWLNVTYNYAPHFARVIEGGIRAIYGITGAESMPLLERAIASLGDDVDQDYWKPTEGNAKAALVQLLTMARLRPDGIWRGD